MPKCIELLPCDWLIRNLRLTSSWTGVPNKVAGECILQYEKIQEFSSDDLNSTLCYAALLLSYGQLTCTDLTCFCHTELCGTDINGQTN